MRSSTVYGDMPLALTTEACQALGDEAVSVESCISQDYFERERELVFRKSWLCIGREDQIPNAGDYFVKEMETFSSSLLITRGRDGIVRGFHNVCSHRCNKLVWDKQGSSRAFVCKFHGWTYQTDGKLKFVPEEEIFPPIDHDKSGLTPVATDVWQGFIFVRLNDRSGVDLQEFMSPFNESLTHFPFDRYAHCFEYRTVVNANWKLVLDAFLESYHVRFLHKRTVAEIFRNSKEDPAADGYGFEVYKRHGRWSGPGIAADRSHPVEDIVMNGAMSFYENQASGATAPPGLNSVGAENWAADGLYVFPNTFWLLSAGGYVTMEALPLSPDRTVWVTRAYTTPARDGFERFAQEYNRILGRDTSLEDAATLEVTQALLASGAKPKMILGDQEMMVRQLHHAVDQVVNGAEASIA